MYEIKTLRVTKPGDFTPSRLPGFYVEGRYFGNRLGQATARAHAKADEFGRAVTVDHTQNGLTFEPWRTIFPRGAAPQARMTATEVLARNAVL